MSCEEEESEVLIEEQLATTFVSRNLNPKKIVLGSIRSKTLNKDDPSRSNNFPSSELGIHHLPRY